MDEKKEEEEKMGGRKVRLKEEDHIRGIETKGT